MKKIFKNLGINTQRQNGENTQKVSISKVKQHSECHPKNLYNSVQDTVKVSRFYERSEEKLQAKSVAERKGDIITILENFRKIYPFLSVFLAFATAYLVGLYASDNSYNITFFSMFLSICLVAIFSEKVKVLASKEVFEIQNQSFVFLLIFTFLFSVALSSAGSYLLTIKNLDKSKKIESEGKHYTDSIRFQYLDQISVLDSAILENKSRLSDSKNG